MLKELLKDHQNYHSNLQIDYYITAKAGAHNDYGMYKQALRELVKRMRGLRTLYYKKEKLNIELDEKNYIAENHEDQFQRRYAQLDKQNLAIQQTELDKNIQETEREFKRFYSQAVYFKEKIGKLTDDKRDKLDQEFRLQEQVRTAALEQLAGGKVTMGTLQIAMTLPLELRKKFMDKVKSGEAVKELEQTCAEMPDFTLIDVEPRKLIEE